MTKNTARIRAGIAALADKPYEIISGTVVAGTIDTDAYTVSVQPSDASEPIEGVLLSTMTGNNDGMIVVPKDDSNVIIATIDGPGIWSIVKAGELEQVSIKIGSVTYEMDDTQVNIKNGPVVFNIGASVFKMGTGGESLFDILNDLLTGIAAITVAVGSATSGLPNNAATFTTLQTRLNNLLSA